MTIAAVANLARPIQRGTLCHLLGGGVVRAYPDVVIGEAWDGSYRVQAADEIGWRGSVPRDQLQPLTDDERRAYLDQRASEHPTELQWIPVFGAAS